MNEHKKHNRHERRESIGTEVFEHHPTVTLGNVHTPRAGRYVKMGRFGK